MLYIAQAGFLTFLLCFKISVNAAFGIAVAAEPSYSVFQLDLVI